MATGPRIALYGHDTFGLGHLRRNLTIAHHLARELPEAHLLGLTGSPQVHSFPLPPRFDFVKIPSATKSANGSYRSRALDLTLPELTRLRSNLIADALLAYRPDVVLVDHAPAGMAGELIEPLERLRSIHPNVGLVLGLRDVIDDPSRVRADWAREGLLDWMDRIYDRVLVYGARGIGPSPEEYGLSPRLNGRVRFMEYVLWAEPCAPPALVRERLGCPRGEPLIVATVGGGGDGDLMLRRLLESWRGPRPFRAHLVAVTGPLMSQEAARGLHELGRTTPDARIIEFDPDVPGLVRAADVVVTMGGYNSMTEILAAGTPALVVPRVSPRSEQWIRARAMAERGLCRVLHPDEATSPRLEAELAGLLAAGPRTDGLPFGTNGALQVGREIRELLEERRGEKWEVKAG